MEEIERLANESRKVLGKYCIEECHAYCCRKGYLIVSEIEIDLMAGDRRKLLLDENSIRELLDGKFSLSFENSLSGCPALKDSKCLIHGDKERPKTCKDFPIFILGKKIKISNRCPAKKDNKFFKFIKEAELLGYEIVEELF